MDPPDTPSPKKLKTGEVAFKKEWELSYFFVHRKNQAVCVVCKNIIQYVRKSSIERHYNKFHKNAYEELSAEERQEKFNELQEAVQGEEDKEEPSNGSDEDEEGWNELNYRASCKVALRLARAGKPFTDGALGKEIAIDLVETFHPTLVPVYQKVPLSNMTITRRTKDMAENLYNQLQVKAKNCIAFSIALDETTDRTDTAQLVIFVRCVDENLNTTEELLDVVSLKDTTKGADVMAALEMAIDQMELDWEKIASVTPDGAPAMRGKLNGVIGLLRKKISDPALPAIHCFAHQEALCAKAVDLLGVLPIVTSTVNYLRTHGLTHRQFKEFLSDLEAEYPDVPYYTEVRWLSRGKVLLRFFQLLEQIALFLDMKGRPQPLIQDPKWVARLAFLVDITAMLNELNLKLQGDNLLITDMVTKIKAFRKRLELLKSHLQAGNTVHFPNLDSVKNNAEFEKYVEVITALETEFADRFEDIAALGRTFDLFVKPFSIEINNVPPELQFELLELQSDDGLQDMFYKINNLARFYQTLPKETYPKLRREAAKIMSMFGSTSICERFFSFLNRVKSKERCNITDENLKNTLRLAVSRTSPNINEIVTIKINARKR